MTIHAEISAPDSAGGQRIVLVAGGADPAANAEAAKRLKLLTPLFSTSTPPGALTVPATWPAVVQLQAALGATWRPGPALSAWIGEQAAARTAPLPDRLPAWCSELLELVRAETGMAPRDYQVAGALEIARTGRALVFDEPRTGKTITTILGLILRAGPQQLAGLPVVVVCPASVVDPWVETFARWAPWWSTVAWRGTPARRRALVDTADVYVTSYDTARIDAAEITTTRNGRAPLLEVEAKSLVVDESHYIKSPQTHRTRAVRRLAHAADKAADGSGSFVGLSGTPITHHPADLWPALDCLTQGAWPSRQRWVARYCDVFETEYKEDILGLAAHAEHEFRLCIIGQHRRVARADVMAQLPAKVYSVRTVDLPTRWRKAYDEFESQMLAELPVNDDGTGGGELSVMDVLTKFILLSGLSSAPADVTETFGPDLDDLGQPKRHVHLELKAESWKVTALLELLAERPGEPVVAFAPSAQLVRLAGAAAAAAGYRVGYVVGGQRPSERTEAIRAFQVGELDLICATTGAGGTGITLSRAGTLVFLQRPWSIVESLQAEDRAEGSLPDGSAPARGTEIVDIVARRTIDDRVRAVLHERAGQLSDLVQDPRIVTQLLGGVRAVEHSDHRNERRAS